MSRLQRTCFFASAGLHGLLLVLLLVGSAFVTRKPPEEVRTFEIFEIPKNLVDEPGVLGGGDPTVTTPPMAIPPPAAAPVLPAPPPEAKPERAKEAEKLPVEVPVKVPEPKPEPKPKQPDPEAFDLNRTVKRTVPAKPDKPTIDLSKAEKRTIAPAKSARESSAAEAPARPASDTRVAAARSGAVGDALKRVQGGLSTGGSSIEVPGPGGNSMSYIYALQKRYRDAWVGAATAGRSGVKVEIEIAKDGTVLSARIVTKSGNPEYDRAAQRTIDRVKKVDPFPEGSKDLKRTYRFEITPNELDRG